jgi:hypothetical protein
MYNFESCDDWDVGGLWSTVSLNSLVGDARSCGNILRCVRHTQRIDRLDRQTDQTDRRIRQADRQIRLTDRQIRLTD